MPSEDRQLSWTPLPRSLTDDIGEDPARWLDGPLDPIPRIRGLQTIKRVRGWIAAERLIAKRRDRQQRESILDALGQRESYLERIGEEPAVRDGREIPEKQFFLGDRPWEEVDRSDSLAQLRGRQDPPVAADGGEQRGK